MPRNMSFMLTTEQVRDRSKTVTRRLGWWNVKGGEILNACEQCQGIKRGEKINKLARIRVLNSCPTHLADISREDCKREGFPKLQPHEFVEMFCQHNKCLPSTTVNRIEFEYLDEAVPMLSNQSLNTDGEDAAG